LANNNRAGADYEHLFWLDGNISLPFRIALRPRPYSAV
jgi:hypothetical protein